MFVYGVRCNPVAVAALAKHAIVADYYMEHGVLVFSSYTRASFLESRGKLTADFWRRVAIVSGRNSREIDTLEHPYISDEEAEALETLREVQPELVTSWYYLPNTLPAPALIVSDL